MSDERGAPPGLARSLAADLPTTEALAPDGLDLERLSAEEIAARCDAREGDAACALARARPAIARLGEEMAGALGRGGRIVSLGAGTSGRLAALDAAEWPPTFGVDPARVIALIAGGPVAYAAAVEGAEDRADEADRDLARIDLGPCDLLVGISASGRAPYVLRALEVAAERGAARALITCGGPADDFTLRPAEDSPGKSPPEEPLIVRLETGPELLAGSTRLQAASVTHRVLLRASLICAARCGWIARGRMVEMRPTNAKLRTRAERIVADLAGVSRERAAELLRAADDDIKVAVVCSWRDLSAPAARRLLDTVDRRLDRIEISGGDRVTRAKGAEPGADPR